MNSRGISHGFLLSSALQPLPQNPPPWQRVEENYAFEPEKTRKNFWSWHQIWAKQPNSQTTNGSEGKAFFTPFWILRFLFETLLLVAFQPSKGKQLRVISDSPRSSQHGHLQNLHVVVVNSSTLALGPLALPCSSYTSDLRSANHIPQKGFAKIAFQKMHSSSPGTLTFPHFLSWWIAPAMSTRSALRLQNVWPSRPSSFILQDFATGTHTFKQNIQKMAAKHGQWAPLLGCCIVRRGCCVSSALLCWFHSYLLSSGPILVKSHSVWNLLAGSTPSSVARHVHRWRQLHHVHLLDTPWQRETFDWSKRLRE